MAKYKFLIFYGSARPKRIGIRVANYLKQKLEQAGHEITLFDAKELKYPLLEQPLHFYPVRSEAPDWLIRDHEYVLNADAYIMISGEYNRSMQPGLSNLLNHFPPKSYAYKPCAVAPYTLGSNLPLSSLSHLRDLTYELNMVMVPKYFAVTNINKSFDENSKPQNEDVIKRADEMIKNLLWYTEALKAARVKTGDKKPFEI